MSRPDEARSYLDQSGAAIDPHAGTSTGGADTDGRLSQTQRLLSAGCLVLILSGLAWLAFNNPLAHSFLPRCPTEQYAGFYCTGCGATRATHHLLQGRPTTAMAYNPLLVIAGTPLILLTLASLGYQAATGRRSRRPSLPAFVGWSALVIMIGFGVARNLPGEVFEKLRPTPAEADRAALQGEEGE